MLIDKDLFLQMMEEAAVADALEVEYHLLTQIVAASVASPD